MADQTISAPSGTIAGKSTARRIAACAPREACL